jgi:radical SAM protein with 4Fe4S-binding SPASM domain
LERYRARWPPSPTPELTSGVAYKIHDVHAIEDVGLDAAAFRAAYAQAAPFRPLYVKIKLLYGCNLRCGMCQHWRSARPAQLTGARLVELLDELTALGCRKVHFTGGEPGLRPDLEELVAQAARRGLRVTLTTNATRFDRTRARALVVGGLRGVNVSIDGPVASVHDAVRGVPGAWVQALEGFKNLRKERHRGRLRLSVNTVVTRLNAPSLADMPALLLKIGAQSWSLLPVDQHTPEALRPSAAEIARYNADVAPEVARRARRAGLFASDDEAYPFGRAATALHEGTQGLYALGYYRHRPCFAPFTHALVDHDGQVYVCCMQRGAPLLGDLNRQSFDEIWRGAAYAAVRAGMRDGARLSACHRCDDFLAPNRQLFELLEARP